MDVKQLRYLIECKLQLATKTKQPDGSVIDTYQDIDTYNVQVQELNDEVSANVYGATLYKTYRISSPHLKLENYLREKFNYSQDNISKYFLLIDNKRYRVKSVRGKWIDAELQ